MRRTRSTVTAAVALAIAAVTAVSASVALATGGDAEGPAEFGQPSVETKAAAPSGATGRGEPSGPGPASSPAEIPGTAPESKAPTRLTIDGLNVDAPVVPTGVTKAGNAQIPPDGDVVGWYRYGSAPGDRRGNAVMIGHRDTAAEGPGALFDLDAIERGDVIAVRSGRTTERYSVVALRSIDKDGLPDSLFRRGGPHQLVVITCGGAFIPEAGGYQENLIAIAIPEGR